MRRSVALAAAVAVVATVALCACRPAPQAPAQIDKANPLEVAAKAANLVEDPRETPVTGLFERRHAAGRDALCFTPDGDSDYHFGLTASFGTTLICEGQGSATQDGERLTLRFADADCTVDAQFDGHGIRITGEVPPSCAALCGPRASMSGVSVTRIGWGESDALTLLSRSDVIAGRQPRRLCVP